MTVSCESPDYWRDLAADADTLAERMNDEISKQMMLLIANEYENLAEEIEKRERAKRP
jgi:hypothetical protein